MVTAGTMGLVGYDMCFAERLGRIRVMLLWVSNAIVRHTTSKMFIESGS